MNVSSPLVTICIIGTGPMASYTLRKLIRQPGKLSFILFEAEETAGCGMPYRRGMNSDEMYCNAFSREIPVFTRHLTTWMKEQSEGYLGSWGLTRDEIGTRSFYPRVLLGDYMQDEFQSLCEQGRDAGHDIRVLTGHRVTDILPGTGAAKIVADHRGLEIMFEVTNVVIATGHSWPDAPCLDGIELVSPWPVARITDLAPARIGIVGSSLSAIDVVVAMALHHGAFGEESGKLCWIANDAETALRLSLISHKGILPEPDFFYPYPYTPLRHLTTQTVAAEIAAGPQGLLSRLFTLLMADLREAASEHVDELGPAFATIEGFQSAYFKNRMELGGFRALRANLKQAEESFETETPQLFRYALLRAHEFFEPALHVLDDADWTVFMVQMMPVFGDCYAAIPHISVQRVLALYDAGALEIVSLSEGAAFTRQDDEITTDTTDGPKQFETLIDARGQSAASVAALPFPSLVRSLRDPDGPLMPPYKLDLNGVGLARVHCLAMPQILERNPFAQGLPNCAEIADIAVADMAQDLPHTQDMRVRAAT